MQKPKYYPVLTLLLFSALILSCGKIKFFNLELYSPYKYEGDVNLEKYNWIKGRKIFVDAGHGGAGISDRFRIGPGGITEEEVNLRVAMILGDMFERAGADVAYSRESDKKVLLQDRVEMVKEFEPDLLISAHHNGTARRMDSVNYPTVLIWGHKQINPLSYGFAELLLDELQRLMKVKGSVLSDFSVFRETGTMILRETRYTCPGVIGEGGFFSDEMHAKRLDDIHYNQEEAEAYFYAASRFFESGLPKAEVLISSPVDNESYLNNLVKDTKPIIAIKTDSGLERAGIIRNSMSATLDNIRVRCKAVTDDLFFVEYGKKLYPGGHLLRFSFRNKRNQSSMIFSSGFTVEINKGDYDRLVSEGKRLLKRKRDPKEGLKMLLSAHSMGLTDPGADKIIWNIAKGFSSIGDRANSDYYYARLYYFYPQSKYVKMLKNRFRGYRFPVDHYGKYIKIKYEPSLKDESRK